MAVRRRNPPHTATHCNTLQHTATSCHTLQHAATLTRGPQTWRPGSWQSTPDAFRLRACIHGAESVLVRQCVAVCCKVWRGRMCRPIGATVQTTSLWCCGIVTCCVCPRTFGARLIVGLSRALSHATLLLPFHSFFAPFLHPSHSYCVVLTGGRESSFERRLL